MKNIMESKSIKYDLIPTDQIYFLILYFESIKRG